MANFIRTRKKKFVHFPFFLPLYQLTEQFSFIFDDKSISFLLWVFLTYNKRRFFPIFCSRSESDAQQVLSSLYSIRCRKFYKRYNRRWNKYVCVFQLNETTCYDYFTAWRARVLFNLNGINVSVAFFPLFCSHSQMIVSLLSPREWVQDASEDVILNGFINTVTIICGRGTMQCTVTLSE